MNVETMNIDDVLLVIGLITGIALAYGKTIGPYQSYITQAVIDAMQVATRYKRITNLAVGVVLALGLTAVVAVLLDTWEFVPAGVLAGVLSSVEAARKHDEDDLAEQSVSRRLAPRERPV